MSENFENLPNRILKRIIANLSLCDILNLSSTSKTMNSFCNSNEVWKLIFKRHFGCYATIHDYRKFLDYNNWKILCYDVFMRNVHRAEFIEYLLSTTKPYYQEFSDDSETETLNAAKVWPSIARTNLFEVEELHHHCDSDLSDCEEHILEITELHKSISSASLDSFTLIGSQNSSKANLLLNTPSNSAASLNYIRENDENVNEVPTRDVDEASCSKNNNNEDVDNLGIGYTRREIKRRLNNLVKMSFKNFSGDPEDLLPATKNGKYALRYRDESDNSETHQN